MDRFHRTDRLGGVWAGQSNWNDQLMTISISTILVALVAAGLSFFAGVFSTQKKFRSEILRLAVDASKQDFDAMSDLDHEYRVPMSVSLAFYVSYFGEIAKGSDIKIATNVGVEGMKTAVATLKSTNISFYKQHQALAGFLVVEKGSDTGERSGKNEES